MGTRALSRLGLDDTLLARLRSRSLQTVRDVLLLSPLELTETLDIAPAAAAALLRTSSRSVLGAPVTALELHRQACQQRMHQPSGLQVLDAALRGGVPCGSLTELVGPAGVGKSQLCLMLAASMLLDPALPVSSQVLYIDTERKFSAGRLVEVAAARAGDVASHHDLNPGGFDPAGLAARVLVASPASVVELLSMLQGLEAAVIERGVRLVVVDSIAALARADFAAAQLPQRQQALGQAAAALKHLAETFRIPVVVTSGGQGGGLVAALGALWAHAVNTRLVLESVGAARYVKVAKSAAAPDAAVAFRVTARGLEADAEAPALQQAGAGVVGQAIRHSMDYEPSEAMATAGDILATAASIEDKLRSKLDATDVTVLDTSGGCGAAFEVVVVSPMFEGKALLQRHRMVNTVLAEELKTVHALAIKKCLTPAQQAALQPAQ
ncbi:hypothetical protein WJX81_000352 [Elliptochloris bilobata]|uniref:RecA family profile 1 domain-containing protein n=1 Tax=Elliptochloris bilobata TaxID=381761 RepID=A0AAW1S2U9_9CHLO